MSEYGFEIKSPNCGGKSCIPVEKIKDFDEFSSVTGRFTRNLLKSSAATYRRLSCNPKFKEKVAPKVELIWTLFPLNIVLGIPGVLLEVVAFPFCWCIQVPFYTFITLPWNLSAYFLIGLVLAIVITLLGAAITLFVVSGWVLASFIATVIINTIVFVVGSITTFSLFLLFVAGAIIGSTLAIIFAPGIIFYFCILIIIGLIFPG